MRYVILISLLHSIKPLIAGTGQTKDMGLMYLLLLTGFAVVLLIWNGIDHIKKNRIKIVSGIVHFFQFMRKQFGNDHHRLETSQ